MNTLVMIMGMFIVTFGIRYVLYARAHRVVLPDWVENALRFVPVAVLTAIIMPMILMPQGDWALNMRNPWIWGGLSALLAGLLWHKPLVTIVAGVTVFFGSQALL